MSQGVEWQSEFSKLLGGMALGSQSENRGPHTARFSQVSDIANNYLTHLVPADSGTVSSFRFFDVAEIEENLTELVYSAEFRELEFLPIAEFENDKLVCIDCQFPAFVVLQLGMGTIQPIRRYLLHRYTQFSDFLKFVGQIADRTKN